MLFDRLVGTSMKRGGNVDLLFPGRFKIDYELKGCGLHDWKLCGVGTIQNFSGVNARLAIGIWDVRAITHKPTYLHKLSEWVDRRSGSCPALATIVAR